MIVWLCDFYDFLLVALSFLWACSCSLASPQSFGLSADSCLQVHFHLPYKWEVLDGSTWTELQNMEDIERDFCDPSRTERSEVTMSASGWCFSCISHSQLPCFSALVFRPSTSSRWLEGCSLFAVSPQFPPWRSRYTTHWPPNGCGTTRGTMGTGWNMESWWVGAPLGSLCGSEL